MKKLDLKNINRKHLVRLLPILTLSIVMLFVGGLSFVVVRQITLIMMTNSKGLTVPGSQVTPELNTQGTPSNGSISSTSAVSDIMASENPWDGVGRVTVLLLGLDYRDWEAGSEASRSDTMILLTMDPQTRTAGIFTIPRDLWVSIPGFKHGKINTAYYLGDAYKLPGGGPALSVKTVEQLLGVPINYYAQIDFGAFVRFIDEIGGVKINVAEEITIDLLGSGAKTKKKLKPGTQVLPGEWALAYARTRSTEGGDFDRGQRQMQVILAIRDRILSLELLPTLISKAPTLYNELASGIRTNLSVDELIKLALAAQFVPEENIRKATINKDNVYFAKSPDGLDILIPIPDDIFLLRDQVFAGSGSLAPGTPGDAVQRIVAEQAAIALYNASRDPGLLNRTAEFLRSLGVLVAQSVESGQIYSQSVIIDHTGNPFTLRYLVDWMSISPNNISLKFDPTSAIDVEIFLGEDWANRNNLP